MLLICWAKQKFCAKKRKFEQKNALKAKKFETKILSQEKFRFKILSHKRIYIWVQKSFKSKILPKNVLKGEKNGYREFFFSKNHDLGVDS